MEHEQKLRESRAIEAEGSQDGEFSRPIGEVVLDFVGVIIKWKRFFVWFIGVITVGTTVIALLSPRWYKATASVFPAQQADLFGGLEGVSSLVKTFGGGGRLSSLTGPTETDRYLAILKSENALLRVIEKFDLTKVYEITSYPREKTMGALLSNTQFDVTDQGVLQVSVYDREPQRAADMANYFVEVLNDINTQLNAQNAKGNREFIEQRYSKNLADIRAAEDSLKMFQLRHGVIAMPEQTEASIKAGAELYGQLAVKEIELSTLKRTLAPSHPKITAAEIEIDEIHKKLRDMNTGAGLSPDEMKIIVPFRQAPALGAEYIRLFRDAEIQYKILQFITPLYEQAKVEEQRSTPSVVVLDHASVPERKAKPKASLYLLLAFAVSSLVSLVIVFSAEGASRLRAIDPERWKRFLSAARSDWFGLRWKHRSN